MSLEALRLAWTLLLAPRRPHDRGPRPWPPLLARLGVEPAEPLVDPLARMLHGPVPVGVLARHSAADGTRCLVSGLGDTLGVTIIVTGEDDSVDELRRRAAAVLGLVDGAESPTGEGWRSLGIAETQVELGEGNPPGDPPRGWVSLQDLELGRAVGEGAGHVAWRAVGYYIGATERVVMDRRLEVLLTGHEQRWPALVGYAAGALRWAEALEDALRQSEALGDLLSQARAVSSDLVAGGDGGGARPLMARLDVMRQLLRESADSLLAQRSRMEEQAERLGPRSGSPPFPETGAQGNELVERLRTLERSAERWMGALERALR